MKITSLLSTDPLENATVRINELGIESSTNSEGIITFNSLPQGSYSLTVSNEGYISKYISFLVTSNTITDLKTIELNSQKGQLIGSIVSKSLNNLSNILIYLKSADGSIYTALTNSTGEYSFNTLPIGEGYSVIANAHDFQLAKINNITIENTKTTNVPLLELIPYPILTVGEVQSVNVGSISGYTRYSQFSNSLDHAGIIVSIEGTDYEAITAKDGSYIFNNIPKGTYTLNYTDSNYKTQSIEARVIAGSDNSLSDVTLLPKTGSIKGKATLFNKVSSAGIKVEIIGTEYVTYTDIAGDWSLNVGIGNYPSGIKYSKELYTTYETTETITVLQNGYYNL